MAKDRLRASRAGGLLCKYHFPAKRLTNSSSGSASTVW